MQPFLGSEDLLIDMAELFKVFGDSTRIKILCCLFDGEMYVQAVSYTHLTLPTICSV